MRKPGSDAAVLLMAHGTLERADQMPEYLRFVRGGREPSPQLVEEMVHNLEAIGGRSPLTDITLAQGRALQDRLTAEGYDIPVFVGMRNWKPFIADAVRTITASGAARVIGIPLAPQFSTLSVQKYMDAAQAALPPRMAFTCVRSFHDHPLLIEAFAERLSAAHPEEDEEVIFTAHSLPQRVADGGDPYPQEVAATAKLVAARVGLPSYSVSYQSAGRTPEPWLGPDLPDFIRARAQAGARRVLIAPIGFVCDHTEILYDIDVAAAAAARESGIGFRRTESLNTSPTFMGALAALVAQAVTAPTPHGIG